MQGDPLTCFYCGLNDPKVEAGGVWQGVDAGVTWYLGSDAVVGRADYRIWPLFDEGRFFSLGLAVGGFGGNDFFR